MKKKIMILFSCISLGAAVYFFMQSQYMLQQESVYLAVVGPMGQPNGKAMRQGVELYREQINQQGGVDGRKLEFIFRDDQNDPEQAERIAYELAEDNKVLVVLGHYYDSTSKVAGKIYKKNEIPAITASASTKSVIRDNKWYFRTVPGNALEAKFLANYIGKALKSRYASIIFSNDDYGRSLLEGFEKTVTYHGMEMVGKWEWNYDKPADEQVKAIQDGLAATDNPGVVYFAVHAVEGAKIITALKDAGASYPIIGSYAFARSFFDKLKLYAKEWEPLGYYSDGIYVVSPFMLSLSGVKGFEFARQFFRKYNEKSGVVSACYYDAAQVAVQAIKKTGVHGKKHIRADRRNIRKALAGMYNEDSAIQGVTGLLWFDEAGGVRREYAVGRWDKQKEVAAFVQYDRHAGNVDDVLQGALSGEAVLTDDLVLTSTSAVHVGVKNFELLDVDSKKLEFTAAFRLQFSYPARFDSPSKVSVISPLEFTNALAPVVLGEPIKEEIGNGIVTKSFHVQGRFRADFDSNGTFFFNSRQKLFIRFRHSLQVCDNLIYLPEDTDEHIKQVPNGWSLTEFRCYSDILSKITTLGNPKYFNSDHSVDYSRFNIKITATENFSFNQALLPSLFIVIIICCAFLFMRTKS